jgi:uncharacterized protein YjdB
MVCAGGSITLSDATTGGTWSSEGTYVATVSATGVVTGLHSGIVNINYTTAGGCSASIGITIGTPGGGSIDPHDSICLGSSIAFVDPTGETGGTWSSSNTVVASVSSTGVVTGIADGMSIISYTVTDLCGTSSAISVAAVISSSSAGTIYGVASVSAGSTASYYDYATGVGTWSVSNTSVATIDASTGILTALSAGTDIVSYVVTGCSGSATAVKTVTVTPSSSAPAISGPASGCPGGTYYFSDSTGFTGIWSVSDASVAYIDASTGRVVPLTAGSVTITYTYGSSYATTPFTIYPLPSPISEASGSFCSGTTEICTDATPGGTWSTSDYFIASVDGSGVVTGVSGGIADISYTSAEGCSVSRMDTILSTTITSLSGATTICVGSSTTLSDSGSYTGTWSSSNPAVATISSTGVVTGLAAGNTTVTFSVSTGICGAGFATLPVTVSTTTDSGTIYSSGTVYVGGVTTLTDYSYTGYVITGGTWATSDPSIATISASGVVTGISTGTANISYTVMGCGGSATTTTSIFVTTADSIAGNVVFSGTPYYGSVDVYLITYNPLTHDLEAVDSEIVYASGTSAFYHFTGMGTDSFRVKAAIIIDSSFSTYGYVPTYHTSSLYWNAADVIYHTAGTLDLGKDIDMAYGLATTGPGFIGGDVTMGANRGTSVSIPAVHMLVFVIDASTGRLIQQTYTDASGAYSFTGLPLGTYIVYPEDLNYATTAYTGISLTSATPSLTTASFIQHTVSHTITPVSTAVKNIPVTTASVTTFPNPAIDRLNILWNETAHETGTMAITDIAGREITKTQLDMTQGTGSAQADVSGLANGIYMITIKSGNINYNSKIQVQH